MQSIDLPTYKALLRNFLENQLPFMKRKKRLNTGKKRYLIHHNMT
jgi:hypothetical protein